MMFCLSLNKIAILEAMTTKSFFITGTDTGVGKTLVSAALLLKAKQQGLSTAALKPIAAGCNNTNKGLRNEDALTLMAQMTANLSYEQVNPVALVPPIAPHIAAAEAGIDLKVDTLAANCQLVLQQGYDLTLVEGAGGWQVPINSRETLVDLVVCLRLPVVLVVGLRLGCINHALLTAQAIQARGLTLAAWVANQIESDLLALEENIAALVDRLDAPFLGHIPFLDKADPIYAAEQLSIESLLRPF